jgi:hypothetical protein
MLEGARSRTILIAMAYAIAKNAIGGRKKGALGMTHARYM